MLLARDHAGVKPLFYVVQGQTIYFASKLRHCYRYPPFRIHSIWERSRTT
ncbi:MAG: hypothetical protein IPF84_04195 [Proteobacteria bacterium]|nr:hypothetical protein [Pseudomonadota bacterium]